MGWNPGYLLKSFLLYLDIFDATTFYILFYFLENWRHHNLLNEFSDLYKKNQRVQIVLQLEFGVVLLPWMFGVTIIVIMSLHTVQQVFVYVMNKDQFKRKRNNKANLIRLFSFFFVSLHFLIEITIEGKIGPGNHICFGSAGCIELLNIGLTT